jgi:hypothetical protein
MMITRCAGRAFDLSSMIYRDLPACHGGKRHGAMFIFSGLSFDFHRYSEIVTGGDALLIN